MLRHITDAFNNWRPKTKLCALFGLELKASRRMIQLSKIPFPMSQPEVARSAPIPRRVAKSMSPQRSNRRPCRSRHTPEFQIRKGEHPVPPLDNCRRRQLDALLLFLTIASTLSATPTSDALPVFPPAPLPQPSIVGGPPPAARQAPDGRRRMLGRALRRRLGLRCGRALLSLLARAAPLA